VSIGIAKFIFLRYDMNTAFNCFGWPSRGINVEKTGDILKKLRLEKEKTQNDIALVLDITPKTISFYENNERMPPPDKLAKLADYFNVSVDYLLGRADPPIENKDLALLFRLAKGFTEDDINDVRALMAEKIRRHNAKLKGEQGK
jgi:transcriptional regulator with XRE-family HTH domain